jgi:hypothetical protein
VEKQDSSVSNSTNHLRITMNEEAQYIVAVFESTADRHSTHPPAIKKQSEKIVKRYSELKGTMGFEAAARWAKTEWLAEYLKTVIENK